MLKQEIEWFNGLNRFIGECRAKLRSLGMFAVEPLEPK